VETSIISKAWASSAAEEETGVAVMTNPNQKRKHVFFLKGFGAES
jgi:hypothetical protein